MRTERVRERTESSFAVAAAVCGDDGVCVGRRSADSSSGVPGVGRGESVSSSTRPRPGVRAVGGGGDCCSSERRQERARTPERRMAVPRAMREAARGVRSEVWWK